MAVTNGVSSHRPDTAFQSTGQPMIAGIFLVTLAPCAADPAPVIHYVPSDNTLNTLMSGWTPIEPVYPIDGTEPAEREP